MNQQRIPVTIISGFLGAGKTTLLNSLIKNNPDKKFAIIENEFGEIGIDNELVVGADEGIFELANGCVCCSLNDELVNVLNKLLNSSYKIDHLIVETTGIADPGPVALSFISDYKIENTFELNGILTLCDALNIEQQLEDHEEACRQVAMADVILLNKVDSIDGYRKEVAVNLIKRINSNAVIKESTFGEVKDFDILSIHAFKRENIIQYFEANTSFKKESLTFKPNKKAEQPNSLFSHKSHYKQLQHSDISSYSFVLSYPLDIMKFDIWLRMILNLGAVKLYRVKGILDMYDVEKKIIIQAVNNQYRTESGGEWGEETKQTKIVFIGKNLSKEILEKGLEISKYTGDFNQEEFFSSLQEFEKLILN